MAAEVGFIPAAESYRLKLNYVGGSTVAPGVAGLRLLTDTTFDPAGAPWG